MFSSVHGQNPWLSGALIAAGAESADVRSLSLGTKGNLASFHKYVTAMELAVEWGVAKEGSVVPDIAWAQSKRNPRVVAIRKQNELVLASAESVGVSKCSDIDSYSLVPHGSSNLDIFEHMCRLRKYGDYTGGGTLDALDVNCTESQTKELVVPSDEEKRIGQMLKDANTRSKGGYDGNRLGTFGEREGACRQSNTADRIERLATKERVLESIEELVEMKTAQKRKSDEAKLDIYDSLVKLVGVPKKGNKFSAAELKAYINDKLDGRYPTLGKKAYKTLAVIVPFLVKTSKYRIAGKSLNEAATQARKDQNQLLKKEEIAKATIERDSDDDESDEDDDESDEDDDDEDDDDDDASGGDGCGGCGGGASGREVGSSRGESDASGGGGGGGDGGGGGGSCGERTPESDFVRRQRETIADNKRKFEELFPPNGHNTPVKARKTMRESIQAEKQPAPYNFRNRNEKVKVAVVSPPSSPDSSDASDASSFALDVNAIFGVVENATEAKVWYYVKLGHGAGRKVYYLDHVDTSNGTCTLNDREGYDVSTVNDVKIRKVFHDVRFSENYTATLDTSDLQEVQNCFLEYCGRM
jgi:uncharacterized membrane protein YgcG